MNALSVAEERAVDELRELFGRKLTEKEVLVARLSFIRGRQAGLKDSQAIFESLKHDN